MKRLFSTLLVGAAVAATAALTAPPASAACYDYPEDSHMALRIPTACVGDYDYCDADYCIEYPWSTD